MQYQRIRVDDPESDLAYNLPDLYEVKLGGQRMLFVDTLANMMMVNFDATAIPDNMMTIIGTLHKVGLCAGLFVDSSTAADLVDLNYVKSRFLDMFAVSQDGLTSVDFVNFSRMRTCDLGEAESEMENFVDAFHDELHDDLDE